MATTSAAIRDLSDQNSQGTRLGVTSTDLIGFYGVTTCSARLSVSGSISSGALASSLAQAMSTMGLVNVAFSA